MQRDDGTHLGDEFLVELDLARVEVDPVQSLDCDSRPLHRRRRRRRRHLFPFQGPLILVRIAVPSVLVAVLDVSKPSL